MKVPTSKRGFALFAFAATWLGIMVPAVLFYDRSDLGSEVLGYTVLAVFMSLVATGSRDAVLKLRDGSSERS